MTTGRINQVTTDIGHKRPNRPRAAGYITTKRIDPADDDGRESSRRHPRPRIARSLMNEHTHDGQESPREARRVGPSSTGQHGNEPEPTREIGTSLNIPRRRSMGRRLSPRPTGAS